MGDIRITRGDMSSLGKRETKKTKRANGRGTIAYVPAKAKPYIAKVKAELYTNGNKVQVRYTTIGSFKSRSQAEKALEEYFINPYDVESRVKTFKDLYDAWFEGYSKSLKSDSSIRTVKSAVRYCEDIFDMPIRKIGIGHLKDLIENAHVTDNKKGEVKMASPCTKERIKSMCNMMFDYAVEHQLILSNPSRAFNVDSIIKEIEKNRKVKNIFSREQILILWEHLDKIPFVDMVLIGIYTGFRPQELCLIETKNVHLKEGYIVGGIKTENGINRRVPIHPEIYDLVEKRVKMALKYDCDRLFFKIKSGKAEKFTYNSYRYWFGEVMKTLEFENYSPHCTRHTFATLTEQFNLRYRAVRLIMGHSQKNDITNNVYIHTDIDYLIEEISKIKVKGEAL